MSQLVTITSQGQISIPAKMRRRLGFDKYNKALVKEMKGKLLIEPVQDFLDSAGILKNKALKGIPINQVIKLEEEAAAQGFVEGKR